MEDHSATGNDLPLDHGGWILKSLYQMKEARPKKSTYYKIPFILNSVKCKLVHRDRKQICSCLRKRRGMGDRERKTLGDGDVQHLDRGRGFMGVYRSQNFPAYTP